LIVDDNPDMRVMVAHALQRPQRTFQTAQHGEDALAYVAHRQPSLIITDVVMPRLNGWALVRQLRATATTAFIPVIFMTGLSSTADRIRGFRIGADDYITKPVDLEELELRVMNVLHRSRGAQGGSGLVGDLSQFGLATPLTILELERKTGVLTAERPPGRAELAVRGGRIVHAKLVTGERELVGIDCMCELLMWSTGRFAFAERDVDSSTNMEMTTSEILLEAARKMDELIPVDA
jgi:DNA-binding response OmpR family regulator